MKMLKFCRGWTLLLVLQVGYGTPRLLANEFSGNVEDVDAQVLTWLMRDFGLATDDLGTMTMQSPVCSVTIIPTAPVRCQFSNFGAEANEFDGVKAKILQQVLAKYGARIENEGATLYEAMSIECQEDVNQNPVCLVAPRDGGGSTSFGN